MHKSRLIKLTLTAALLLGVEIQAQTNATYLNIRAMPASLVGNLDYLIYGKASGTNYFWNRIYVSDFYANFTNTAAGQSILASLNTNAAAITATATANTSTSNSLASTITATAAANAGTSNSVTALALAASAKATGTSNGIVALLSGFYPSNNPSGFQTAGQVTAAANVAVATYAATASTNGGSATLTNLIYQPLNLGNVPTAYYTFNMAAASVQILSYTNTANLTLNATNYQPGQNVTLIVLNKSKASPNITLPSVGFNYASSIISPGVGGAAFISILSTATTSFGAHLSSAVSK